MTRAPRPRRSGESGFALLLVFLMAALIAIMLYRELPRLAFESQRAKEQLAHRARRAVQARHPAFREEDATGTPERSRSWRIPTTSASCAAATKTR